MQRVCRYGGEEEKEKNLKSKTPAQDNKFIIADAEPFRSWKMASSTGMRSL